MKKITTLKEFINNISGQWFKDFFLEKVDSLRLGFLENSDQTFGDFKPDIKIMNYILNGIKESVANIDSLEELKAFIAKYSFNNNAKGNLKIIGDEIQSELIETLNKNPNNIQEKITEIIIKMQINNITRNIKYSVDTLETLLSKIGEDTLIEDVLLEDIEYIINENYKISLEKLKIWSKQNPIQSKNYEDELEILESDKSFIEKKMASEIIEHYFNTIIGADIDENEITNLNPQNLNSNSKIIIFNKGIMICDELYSKLSLINKMLESKVIFKK
ncbi:hypothetical protein [Spiroplasma taiwanense]|uniref:Uncharacterized protein n=1 Tax=Spiroplasma taiwanense CT-1 TaxID=1276220 RepID=S5MH26_9MOLU|nr:hypothetical protein [Spiroplasma taiwanense]AGR41145.1 hypothetical protein STAIW_v1c05120 [Spiroplasma taiwanense CT-1]